ncbi:hypothetical protein [Desertivirga xinjiangensis]|uniref:hypothetical protein n=1 Tax=Desertivirga xinjiangensis TaxID=539206 RepID=UPI00210A4540|nr:hypothetical protein [Pedobacter xinjiangensis]
MKPEESDFGKSGKTTIKTKIEFEITEVDLLKDLVEKTEGNNIKVDNPPEN